MIRLLARRGVLDDDLSDGFACDEPLLAGMTSASILGLVSTGERAGRRVRRVSPFTLIEGGVFTVIEGALDNVGGR